MDKELQTTQFLLYKSENDKIKVDVLVQDETVWLTQIQMVELYLLLKAPPASGKSKC